MTSHDMVPQQLQQIVDRGFPEPQYTDLIAPGSYNRLDPADAGSLTDTPQVGFCFDGSFLPIRNGASYTLHNLMRALAEDGQVQPNFVNCYRGWDDPGLYAGQDFRSILLHPADYYQNTGVVESAFEDLGITNAQFYSSEGLLNLGPRLKHIGARAIFEVQNTDHILLQRLGASAIEIAAARDLQVRALEIADHTFCRSEQDAHYAVELGADPSSVSLYRGGIRSADFEFAPRTEPRNKLVYLGHMYYQPNENALDYIAGQVLPGLDESYRLTVVGIAPPKLQAKYDDPRIVFVDGVDDLSDELLKHDIALAPLLEGSGTRLKILDYLASGLPVITTSLGTEGLDAGINDHLTVEDDLDNYSHLIKSMMAGLPGYAERSRQGRRFVETQYDWATCIGPFLEVYQR